MSDSAVLYPAETNSGTVTSYIPLTTTWTPPSTCSTKYRLDGPSLMAFDPGYGLDIETGVVCGPLAMTTWWEQGRLGRYHGSYVTRISIGPMSCPDNWSTLASSTKDSSSVLAMCCPSGFYLEDAVPGSVVGNCLSKVSSGMTLTYGSTAKDDSTSWSMATTTMTHSSTVGAIGMVGWNIKYPSTATATSTTSTTTTTPSTSGTSMTSATITTPSTSATSQSSNSSSPSSLYKGAKIGIGVGIGVGAIGVIALLTALYLFRWRKQRTPAEPDQSLSHHHSQPLAMSVPQAPYQQQYPAELDAPKLLPGQPAELSSRN